ncbi:MAG: hypothetical protein M0R74_04845, partial [Dehalococcoidia bacterium]|nr:hypothetical protein [Dehalococcoidia bacterium]
MNLLNTSLAWRSAAGRRTARVSFFVRVLGVGFATLVLLLAASASDALHSRGDRVGWRTDVDMSFVDGITPSDAWFQVSWNDDHYFEHAISHVRVVQRAPEAIVPPGLPRIPGEGEVFVSPALAKLIEADHEILGNRYGDTIAGTISR